MFYRLFPSLFLVLILHANIIAQDKPELVIPRGFFMVSAGLNDKGDIVTISASNKLKVWNLDSLKPRYEIDYEGKYSYNAHFSADGNYIIIPDSKGRTTVLYAPTGKILYSVDGWVQDILKKEVSRDGKHFVTTPFTGNAAKVWDLATGKLVRELGGHGSRVMYASYSNKGDRIVTGDVNGNTKLWDAGTGSLLFTVGSNTRALFCILFSDDDKYIATASYDNTSTIIETGTGKIISTIKGHTSLITDLQFSGDNKLILTASNDKLAAIWNVVDGSLKMKLEGHTGEVLTCRFAENERSIITSSSDGTIKKWSAKNGTVLQTVPFNGAYGTHSIYNDWLVLCNSDRINLYSFPGLIQKYSLLPLDSFNHLVFDSLGRYDGTEAARKLLYFTCGKEIIELDQVKDQLWVPGLAERINSGETIYAKTLNELEICNLTPRTETISDPSGNYRFKITPARGGLGETILYVNGIEVKRYRPADLKKTGNSYELAILKKDLANYLLSDGSNRVIVRSFTSDNSFSSRGAIGTNTGVVKKNTSIPNLYAIMVGVSDYKGDDLDLKYAAKDATDVSAALSDAARKLLNADGNEHVFTYNLTTAAKRYQLPEKNAIKQVIGEIGKRSKADDILVIFFAGHGVTSTENKQFYFLTAEASSLSNAGPGLGGTGISMAELSEWIKPQNLKAQKRILIFDACNSGQAIKDFVKMGNDGQEYMAARNDDKARQIKAIDKLNERAGLFILAASASNQSAYEMGRYSQGLLTYSLLKAMKEQPDILQEGKYLDVSRWFNAAEKTVNELTKDNAERQQPQIVSNTNFNIGLVDEDVMEKIVLPLAKPLFSSSNLQNRDEAISIDDLGLNKLVDEKLNNLSGLGAESKISFIPAARATDAYRVSGRYEINGDTIIARIILHRGRDIKHRFEVRNITSNTEALAEEIAKRIVEFIK